MRGGQRAISAAVMGVLVLSWSLRSAGQATPPVAPPTPPAAGASVDVKIVDKVTGKPIKGAKCWMQTNTVRRSQVLIDPTGVATVDLNEGDQYLMISLTATGYVPLRATFRPQQTKLPATLEAKMEKGIQIGGVVVDEEGKPFVGANVVLNTYSRASSGEGTDASPWVADISYKKALVTDAEGKWVFDGAPSEPVGLSVGVYSIKAANAEGFYPFEEAKDVAGLKGKTFKTVLGMGKVVKGKIVDKEGKPVAGVEVGIGRDRVASNMVPPVKTDGEGNFEMGAKAGAEIVVTAKMKGYAPALETFVMPNEGKELKITLGEPKTLTGRVVGPDGTGMKQAYVWVDTWRGTRTLQQTLRTDAEGNFKWEGAPEDEVEVDVEVPGFTRQSNVKIKAGQPNEIKMAGPVMVRGTVVDEETGKPVTGFTVIPGIKWEGEQQPISWERGDASYGVKAKTKEDGTFEMAMAWPYPGYALRVEADGYAPSISQAYSMKGGDQTLTFKMKKAESIKGVLKDSDGKAVSGVRIMLVGPGNPLQIQNGEIPEYAGRGMISAVTKADGSYSFPAQTESVMLVAVTPAGFVKTTPATRPSSDQVLQKWARVHGVVKIGSKPAVGEAISANAWDDSREQNQPSVYVSQRAVADASGNFVLNRMMPGKFSVGREVKLGENMTGYTHMKQVEVKAGEDVEVKIGGTGRPVVGKIELNEALKAEKDLLYERSALSTLQITRAPEPELPDEVYTMPMAKRQAWYRDWMKSEDGKKYMEQITKVNTEQYSYPIRVKPDGTWRVEDVPTGTYQAMVRVQRPNPDPRMRWNGEQLATLNINLVVPEVPGGQSDEVVDAGVMKAATPIVTKIGDAAPPLPAKMVDDKPLNLAQYSGKHVLVHFWWPQGASVEDPNLVGLKKLAEEHGKDGKLVLVGVGLSMQKPERVGHIAELLGMKWPQAVVAMQPGMVQLPGWMGEGERASLWLIGPDGKVVAKAATIEAITGDVKKAVGG